MAAAHAGRLTCLHEKEQCVVERNEVALMRGRRELSGKREAVRRRPVQVPVAVPSALSHGYGSMSMAMPDESAKHLFVLTVGGRALAYEKEHKHEEGLEVQQRGL